MRSLALVRADVPCVRSQTWVLANCREARGAGKSFATSAMEVHPRGDAIRGVGTKSRARTG